MPPGVKRIGEVRYSLCHMNHFFHNMAIFLNVHSLPFCIEKTNTLLHHKINYPCFTFCPEIWMNDNFLDYLYGDYIVSIFVSNGSMSCLPCFIQICLYIFNNNSLYIWCLFASWIWWCCFTSSDKTFSLTLRRITRISN